MKLSGKTIIIMLVIFAAVLTTALLTLSDKPERVPYGEFVNQLDEGKIESVVLAQDKVEFKIKNQKKTYETDNPNYDTFKEKLLLSGVEIEDEILSGESVSFVLDIIFDAVFFIAIGVIGYRIFSSFSGNFKVIRHTNIRFEDIAGMENVKRDMMYAVDVLKNPEKYKKKGMRPVKGIILEGPPGNGKTMFAKALAEEAGVNFIATKGADFQSMLMAIGPAKIKSLFKKAQKHKPCIIFIDEFDGIGEKRNYAGAGIDKENNRMIITMLNEMDGFSSGNGIMVIAATNSYASLDEALVRPGRFDLKYNIGNPDGDTRRQLIEIYTKGKKLARDVSVEKLVKDFGGLSCSGIETIINEAYMISLSEEKEEIDYQCIKRACEKTRLN